MRTPSQCVRRRSVRFRRATLGWTETATTADARAQIGLVQSLDMFSWWTFSDIFEEHWMRSAPFQNGFGLMTMQGVRKPSWRAFEALAGAGDERLAVSGDVSPGNRSSSISVLATSGGPGPLGVQAFVANWQHAGVQRYSCDRTKGRCALDPAGLFTDQALCDASCTTQVAALGAAAKPLASRSRGVEVTLTVKHDAPSAPTHATVFRIDSAHANPLALWESWGSPQYISKVQETLLHKASETVAELVPVVASGAQECSITVLVPELSAIHVVL